MAEITFQVSLNNEGRIERDELNIMIATLISQRSICQRGKVGCVITRENRVISTGYNGSIIHTPCYKLNCDVNNKCVNAVHAEVNAIAAAAKAGISTFYGTMYVTHGPCIHCSNLIIQSGIVRVVYKTPYTDDLGIERLRKNGVEVIKMSDL